MSKTFIKINLLIMLISLIVIYYRNPIRTYAQSQNITPQAQGQQGIIKGVVQVIEYPTPEDPPTTKAGIKVFVEGTSISTLTLPMMTVNGRDIFAGAP